MHRRGPNGEKEHSGVQLNEVHARSRFGQRLGQLMAGRLARAGRAWRRE